MLRIIAICNAAASEAIDPSQLSQLSQGVRVATAAAYRSAQIGKRLLRTPRNKRGVAALRLLPFAQQLAGLASESSTMG